MENENTDIYNRVVVNSDPDFVENENEQVCDHEEVEYIKFIVDFNYHQCN